MDDASELFGSPDQDGFAFLEAHDANGDGRIDAADPAFASLRVWRDLDGDGVSDPGELKALSEHGIVSLALTRTAVGAENQGHRIGFEAAFTRADGTTGAAQSVYFATDRQTTRADHTPGFTPAPGVELLPLLPGSGLVNSVAYTATADAGFRADWTALADTAAQRSPAELREAFTALLLRWAGVEGTVPESRGPYVDARHLAFLEAFLGEGYREIARADGGELRTYPSTLAFGAEIEGRGALQLAA